MRRGCAGRGSGRGQGSTARLAPAAWPSRDRAGGRRTPPLVQAAAQDGAPGSCPGGVGGDDAGGAVGVGDFQLGDEALVGAVDVAGAAVEAVPAPVPAVAEPGADRVRAVGEVPGHVVGAVAQAVGVHRPAGCQGFVADPAAVDLHLVEAVGGDVQAGALHRPIEAEVLADAGWAAVGLWILVPAGADGHRLPVGGVEESGLDRGGLAPRGRAGGVRGPDADADGDALAGSQRCAGPLDQYLFGAFDPARAMHGGEAVEFEFVRLLEAGAGGQGPGEAGAGTPMPRPSVRCSKDTGEG